MSNEKRFNAALTAMHHLVNTALFKENQHFACYVAVENEFDCAPMVKALWDAKKNCYLPILSKNSTLEFALYDAHTVLKFNRYRILEPDTSLYFPSDQLDVVLMPLVGFDLQGHRLGMGGGYYDRTFQFLHHQTNRKPFMLGLAYEFQKMKQIPVDPWDVSMDGVLTEEKLYLF